MGGQDKPSSLLKSQGMQISTLPQCSTCCTIPPSICLELLRCCFRTSRRCRTRPSRSREFSLLASSPRLNTSITEGTRDPPLAPRSPPGRSLVTPTTWTTTTSIKRTLRKLQVSKATEDCFPNKLSNKTKQLKRT